MNNGLEALSKLEDILTGLRCDLRQENELYVRDFGQDELISIIYKQLQALDIIIKKVSYLGTLSVMYLLKYDYEHYLLNAKKIGHLLTKQEFDLLKEVLGNE